MAKMKAAAIITAGGLGKRFGTERADKLPKQFIPLSGKPIIAHSIKSFDSSESISEIIVVVPDKWVEYTQQEVVDKFNLSKVSKIISGGDERQQSVEKGFLSISSKPDIIVVHDGVRPFVTVDLIEEVVSEAHRSGAAIAACPSTDTIKKSTPEQSIENTLPRQDIWLAQTPQAFKYDILKDAFETASEDGYLGTDESLLVERIGKDVKLVKSSKHNIKITTPEDIELGELILESGILKK